MSSEDLDDEPQSPGWDAIDAALAKVYGDTEPLHYGTVIPAMLGGNNPLPGISAYRRDEPTPHWHFVTYGYSDLYDNETSDQDESGFGIEMTMRVARQPGEQEPEPWALNLLQNLARYVFSSGNVFGPGHTMPTNGPIKVGDKTLLRNLGFVLDPELPPIDTPNGHVEFVQAVGLTDDEYNAMRQWDGSSFLTTMMDFQPLAVTDLGRTSLLKSEAFAGRVQEGIERDGSNCEIINAGDLKVEPDDAGGLVITIGALYVDQLTTVGYSRLAHARPLLVLGNEAGFLLSPAESAEVKLLEMEGDEMWSVNLRPEDAAELRSSLAAKAGSYRLASLSAVTFKVVPTPVLDHEGNVSHVVGE